MPDFPSMETLFGDPIPPPEGFKYKDEFITPSEEKEFICQIASLPLAPYQYGEYEAKRRVYTFGLLKEGTMGDPFPAWLAGIRGRAAKFAGESDPEAIVQAHLIEYSPGSPIGWHRDSPPYQKVVGISLLSECRFQLRRERKGGGWDRFELQALPRSIYLMSGPARSEWQHAIPPVEHLRYSMTFRTASP